MFVLNTVISIAIYTKNINVISSKHLDNIYNKTHLSDMDWGVEIKRQLYSVNDKDIIINLLSGVVYPITFPYNIASAVYNGINDGTELQKTMLHDEIHKILKK